ARFLASFLPFQQRIAKLGMLNSLSQVLLKLISPGVPDTYQGTELWDLSLVDPDNRRPVDFAQRMQLVKDLEPLFDREEEREGKEGEEETQDSTRINRVTEMLEHWEDGRIKLMLLACGLRLRRQYPKVFLQGEYLALHAAGEHADHIVAILRRHEEHLALPIVPRL